MNTKYWCNFLSRNQPRLSLYYKMECVPLRSNFHFLFCADVWMSAATSLDIILLWMLVLQTKRTLVHEKPENKYNLPVKTRNTSSKRFPQPYLPRRSVDVCRVHLLSVLVYSVYLHHKIREFSGFKYHWSWNNSN